MVVRTFKGPPESERVCLFLQRREEKKGILFLERGGRGEEREGRGQFLLCFVVCGTAVLEWRV